MSCPVHKAIMEARDTVKVEEENLEKILHLRKLKEKRLAEKKLTDKEVNEAMRVLCWENFAGCCAPKKGCPLHLAVCDALGLNPKKLYEVKKRAVAQYVKESLKSE